MKLNLYVPTPKRIMWDCEVIEIILSTNSGQIGVLLKMMAYGGNSRAHAFFKQHGWSDGSSKVEANYTSRAAELYRQILTKEVAKSSPADNALLSSPVVASKQPNSSNDFPEFKLSEPPHNSNGKQEHNSLKAPTCSPKAPTHPTFVSSVKKPILDGKKVGGKTGGLGVRKLTTKVMPLMEGFPYYCSYWFPDSWKKGYMVLISRNNRFTNFNLYCSPMKASMSRNLKSQSLLFQPWIRQPQKTPHHCTHVLNTWMMSHQLMQELEELMCLDM
jgi:hypothetical protein